MWQFISEIFVFWAKCVGIGIKFVFDIFGAIDLLCAIVAAGLHWWRREHHIKWWEEKGEPFVRKYGILVVAVQFGIAVIFVAPFVQYKEKADASTQNASLAQMYKDEAKHAQDRNERLQDDLDYALSKREPSQQQSISQEWQPPELPTGCTQVCFRLGDTLLSNVSVETLRTNPLVNPFEKYAANVGFPIRPFIKNNRVFVEARTIFTFLDDTNVILIDGKLQARISRTTRLWECNCNSNVFEIVRITAVDGVPHPIFQVIYAQPDNLIITGVFQTLGNGNGIKEEIFVLEHYIEPKGGPDGISDWSEIKTKPYFKYPAWKYPGIVAQ